MLRNTYYCIINDNTCEFPHQVQIFKKTLKCVCMFS